MLFLIPRNGVHREFYLALMSMCKLLELAIGQAAAHRQQRHRRTPTTGREQSRGPQKRACKAQGFAAAPFCRSPDRGAHWVYLAHPALRCLFVEPAPHARERKRPTRVLWSPHAAGEEGTQTFGWFFVRSARAMTL
jgi:hypothetical protein